MTAKAVQFKNKGNEICFHKGATKKHIQSENTERGMSQASKNEEELVKMSRQLNVAQLFYQVVLSSCVVTHYSLAI